MTLFIYTMLIGFGLCLVVSLWRWYKGPHVADRILFFDLATSLTCGLLVLFSILFKQAVLLDIALLLSLISFASTIGLSFWLEKGRDL